MNHLGRHARLGEDSVVVNMTALPFLFEYVGEGFTRQGERSDCVENDAVHMTGL